MPSDSPSPDPRRLSERVRDAGGWYAWINATLIRAAGPAAVGPYETTAAPTAEQRAEKACPLCGRHMSEHRFDRSTDNTATRMYCP